MYRWFGPQNNVIDAKKQKMIITISITYVGISFFSDFECIPAAALCENLQGLAFEATSRTPELMRNTPKLATLAKHSEIT